MERQGKINSICLAKKELAEKLEPNKNEIAVIVGAGPAGLTAAYELLTRTNIKPIVLEQSDAIGGLSRTVAYKGNRLDIGGHRFFSKSERVMHWWLHIMPLEAGANPQLQLQYQQKHTHFDGSTLPHARPDTEEVMLVRQRRSRIYFLKQFFSYPLSLSLETLQKLGFWRTSNIMLSYLGARLFPRKNAVTLEDFFINRFGKTLYRTFFKSYTEKVWGVPCSELSAEWGNQRIKNLSIREALRHMVQQMGKSTKTDLLQKDVSTSLIEQFLYPLHGPGQLWEAVAKHIVQMGGTIVKKATVHEILAENNQIKAIGYTNERGEKQQIEGNYFFSTMPMQQLVAGMKGLTIPASIQNIAAGLQYRDFITVGLLINNFSTKATAKGPLLDNWIYIQDEGVQLGRLQIFNNWSPGMVAKADQHWLGLEYFCNTTDALWQMNDAELISLATDELVKIGLIETSAVLDGTVVRQEKTYPSYTGTYRDFDLLRNYLDALPNLYLIGRNGMHRYNNSDHSMLTAMVAVDLIASQNPDKSAIWEVNTEEEYHEDKK